MNLERGFSVPQEKGVIKRDGDVWIPVTPDKPVVQRPNQVLVEMQQNEKGEENWQELLGIYTGVLRDESCSVLPRPCVKQTEPTTRDFAPVATYNGVPQNFRPPGHNARNVALVETCNRMLPQISTPTRLLGMNHNEHNTRDVSPVEKLRSFNQNAGRAGSSYLQNMIDVVPHQEVNSFAELMGLKSNLSVRTANTERISSQVVRNWTYKPDSMMPLQNHILPVNQDFGRYNLQQIPTSRLSVAYRPIRNLNGPPMSEAGESSSVARPPQLGPVTRDHQKLLKNKNQTIQAPHVLIDEISTEGNNKQDNAVPPQPAEIGEREHNDFVHDTLGASSAATSTMPEEKHNSDGRNDGEIDLNKTPPQKTPKRKKHRPKVVREGKPKRTRKPKATENNTPAGTSTTKRKYERKKGIKTSTNQSIDATNEVEVSKAKLQAKSCKRALHFDSENEVGKKIKGKEFDHQPNNIQRSKLNLNLDFQGAELNERSSSTVKDVHQNIYRKQQQTDNPYNFIHSVYKVSPQESLPLAATVPPTASKGHTLNVIARNLNARNANINQSGDEGKYGQLHHVGGGLAQLVILANTTEQNIDGKRQPKLQIRPQHQEDLVYVSEKQESNRKYPHTELTQPLMISQMRSHGVAETGHCERGSTIFWQNGSGSSRTSNIEDKINGRSSSLPSGNTTVEDCSVQIENTRDKSLHAQSCKLHLNSGLSYFSGEGKSNSINLTNETNMVIHHSCMSSINSGHKSEKQANVYAEQMALISSHHFAKAQTTSSLSCACVSVKRQTARQTPSDISSSLGKVLHQETKNLQGYGHEYKKITGSQERKREIFSIDDVTDRMKGLAIGNNGKEIVEEEQKALVPYTGDGAVVPFEVFDPIKKRRPRPKVDLDPETNRLWNLLMGKEGSESAETMDNDKQKFWEEERQIFRGRVDSFIARMHLVQGDRRFSKWKGSVVDSVIGVFLTQNVSDHLSSSAFMSLAAKFPLKSTSTEETQNEKRGKPSTEDEVLIRYPDGTTSCHHRMTREPVIDHSSLRSSRLSQYRAENVTSQKNFSINNHTRKSEEGMISSQSSSDSMSFHASEDIRSSSGSNSEAEDQVTGGSFRKTSGPLNLYEQAERIAALQQYQVQEMGSSIPDNRAPNNDQRPASTIHRQNPEMANGIYACFYPFTSDVPHYQRSVPPSTNSWQKMLLDVENSEIDDLEFLGKECTSSSTSAHFDTTNGTGIEHARDQAGQCAQSTLTDLQAGNSKCENHEVLNTHPEQQMNLPTESQSRNNQQFANYSQGGVQEIFQEEGTFQRDPIKYAEAFGEKPRDNQNPFENITLEPTETKTVHVSDVKSTTTSTTSNARKRKAEKERVESFNWDTLRKQVQSEAGTRERSRDTLDSLDYEALRNADVHEISKAIKERGMNNMLAERIKEFLNRLVRDHGGVDLEWLRDVQPDKTKDYLLSIRGLGLKSVECIRLLTLHHLAFPVDTNVGRIAVRLGWVPLQPLPESLQLHLLELYPVLESIQKYLWPRLCMLDQETLYELHYQLITFGKVFCTKRQPNCNACPMRGECRHFASAFASARLALPGPEERRIVCSDVSASSSKSCDVAIKPMPLPPPEENLGRGLGLTRIFEPIIEEPTERNCEPIIEEPTTPESSIEVSERDIEDAFYEDPDEIPVIKLNIDEFTTNLQSIMQGKKEMQEGDMSKALVALSPELASIPMPRLKHISRLRTEHQVYELPDSHPLLKGMDRREPDDPCPYLLAIWTPGETADSVQPPENKCNSSKGGLCNTETCFSCNSAREAQSQIVRGTILIPCRTAMRGSFPLNGTYFQVNEVFADDETSINPIDVPRSLIWNLPRRTVFFGTSVSTIFKGMSTEDIQYCFWKGFVCVRGFDQKTRAPRPLKARLHLPASRTAKQKD